MKSSLLLVCLPLTITVAFSGCKGSDPRPIIQSGRQLKEAQRPFTAVEKEKRLRQFWSDFQEAAGQNDHEWIADRSELPMEDYGNRKDLLESLEYAFPETVRDAVTDHSFDQLERRADKAGDFLRFHYDNGQASEGQYCVDYDFRIVGRSVKFIRISGAG